MANAMSPKTDKIWGFTDLCTLSFPKFSKSIIISSSQWGLMLAPWALQRSPTTPTAARQTWYSAKFFKPSSRYGLKASMYFSNLSPKTSISVETASKASSWTPPTFPVVVWNMRRSAVMIWSEIFGASSGVTFLKTDCNVAHSNDCKSLYWVLSLADWIAPSIERTLSNLSNIMIVVFWTMT